MKFTTKDLEDIKMAVQETERTISGEIVPVVVKRSGYYKISRYRAAGISAVIVFVCIALVNHFTETTIFNLPSVLLLTTASGTFCSVLPAIFPGINRLLIGQNHIDHATRQRAETIFLQEEIFSTKQRTGILIFVSLFEREVIIMADTGISQVVDQKKWDRIVAALIEDVKLGMVVKGLKTAIRQCGNLLLENGFVNDGVEINELRDELRFQ